MKAALLTSLSALALSACAVGPNYVAPIAPPSATAPFVTANAATVTTPADQNWWRMYRDPALDALIPICASRWRGSMRPRRRCAVRGPTACRR